MTLRRHLRRRAGGQFHTGLLIGVVLLGTLVAGCGISSQAAERQALTQAHGEEVTAAIERFETTWLSREAFLNPSLEYEVATEQWANHLGIHSLIDPPTGVFATSATVSEVKVFEYTPVRFKAWAHPAVTFHEESLQGDILRTYVNDYRGTYVFLKSDGKWRLAAYLDDRATRDLEHAPEWMQQLIGEPAHQ